MDAREQLILNLLYNFPIERSCSTGGMAQVSYMGVSKSTDADNDEGEADPNQPSRKAVLQCFGSGLDLHELESDDPDQKWPCKFEQLYKWKLWA